MYSHFSRESVLASFSSMHVVLVSTVEAEVLVFQFLLSVSISGVLLVDQYCFFLLCITSDVVIGIYILESKRVY